MSATATANRCQTLEQKEIHMSEEDLELLITLDDPGEAEEEDDQAEVIIENDPYKVTFGQGDWTCTLARFTGTTNDSMKELGGNIMQPTDQKFEIEVCIVTCSKKGEVVEQRVFYDLVGMHKHFGGRSSKD
jgi:SnoaL-like polyketide cyclase